MKLCKQCSSEGPFAWRRGICTPCYNDNHAANRKVPGTSRDTYLAGEAKRAAATRAIRKATGLCMDCGVDTSSPRCDACMVVRNRLSTALAVARKRKCIELLGGCCKDCGLVSEYPAVYDFHHPDPNQKDFNIAKIITHKWEAVLAELMKCILLCANCHRIRHQVSK